ncbi:MULTISPECIES: single-stranded DNA-binding protein [unclassified Agarivorans]|uniref:single-stranded DNA-binding protein n=1 Tax=unclassified Agarivorans TaxID=2636026 RepID=UPI0026E1C440|nr:MULTISPECIES: single-stranded DNA-binding protein [unclassified Agarivorans]MDO6687799.1 single-stranded DNA-binding protein [Agarivorans sp. 3_MG-2023]MDO6717337.1 single-stranded DNA-binding protein [Agarivorans sp. 2_MG-2023]
MQVICRSNIEILGNLVTKDVTLRYFGDGTAITQFEVLVKKKTKSSAKEQIEVFQITVRGEQAERLKSYAKAGDGVVINGRLRNQRDSAGEIVSAIDAEQLSFVGGPTQLYWNKATLIGEIAHASTLRKSVNDQSYIKLQLATDLSDTQHRVNCNLWAYPAELIAKKAKLGDKLVVEGSLKKAFADDQKVSPILVDGHTCLHFLD